MRLPDRIWRSSCSTPSRAWSTLFDRVSAMATVRCAETRKAMLMAITIESTAVVMTISIAVNPLSSVCLPRSARTGCRFVRGLRQQSAEIDVNGEVGEGAAVLRDLVGDVTDDGRAGLGRRRRANAGNCTAPAVRVARHRPPGGDIGRDLDRERAAREPRVDDVHAGDGNVDRRPGRERQGAVAGAVPVGDGGRPGTG